MRQFQIAVVHLARIELQAAIVLSQIERRGERAVAVSFVNLDGEPRYLLNGPVAVVGGVGAVAVHNGACLTTVVIETLCARIVGIKCIISGIRTRPRKLGAALL